MADNDSQISDWIQQLDNSDGGIRQSARHQLAETGSAAVPALTAALESSSEMMRWEAAKTLGEIRDPASIEPLIEILADDDSVRWVAGSALIAMSKHSVPPLLHALIKDTARIRDGACFVLHHLASDDEQLRGPLNPVVEALMSLDSSLRVPVEAEKALSQFS
jgi:HEAT repeat protein